MKIKNTRELVLRARGHAKHDRIKQGTYGSASVNGHATYEGCAIGCLSTPHRQSALRSFLRAIRDGGGNLTSFEDEDQLRALKREFGIVPELARVAEAIFESLPAHGAAIEFIPAFAEALPEGANITPRQVRKFWMDGRGAIHCGGLDEMAGRRTRHSAEANRDAFLDWLRSKSA